MLIATTQHLARVQCKLTSLRRLYFDSMPGHINAGTVDHRAVAMQLRLTEFEEWQAQQFLPDQAPNDPPAMPGAA